MVEVDGEGRVRLPAELRERLGITPGTEVEVHVDGERAVIEPADDPDGVLERMAELSQAATKHRDRVPYEEMHPVAQSHADTISHEAAKAGEDDDE